MWLWEWGYLWILEPMWSWCLSYFGLLWTTLDHCETFQTIFDYFGPFKKFRAILDPIELSWTIWTTLDHFGPLWTIWTTSLVMMRECPCSTKTREVLENPSPPPSRYPSTVGFGGARIQCCLNRPMSITVYLAQFAAWIKELKTNKSSNIFVPLTTWQRFSEKGICLYLTPLCWAIFNPSTTSTGPEFPGIIMLKAIPFLTASSTHKTPPTTTAFKARSKKSFHFVRNCKRS